MIPASDALLPTYTPYAFPLVKGRGDEVCDAGGNSYLDFYGGHCVASTGHCHPAVMHAIQEQAGHLIFYSAAARLPIRDRAASALVDFAGNGMASVFFCNSGSEANENALRIAVKLTGRRKFVAFRGGFHGRTLLALSVTDSPALRGDCAPLLAPTDFLPFGEYTALAAADFSDVAAVIVEPIQSMAGVHTTKSDWLSALQAKCRRSGTLLVFDEIQTGIGRLGAPFAANLYQINPDIITCAKGMASGLPMGGVLMTQDVANSLRPGDLGSTFGGGPLACAALLATLGVIRDEGLMEHAVKVEARIRAGLLYLVGHVRGTGLLLGLVVGSRAAELKKYLLERRILVGGSNDSEVLRLMPPLNISDAAVEALIASINDFAAVRETA